MKTLKKRLLSSVEVHGKVDIYGIFILFPDFKKFTVYRRLFELQGEGWIKIRKTRSIGGITSPSPNVSRTKKQLYEQLNLL